jgi:hypothetical protein
MLTSNTKLINPHIRDGANRYIGSRLHYILGMMQYYIGKQYIAMRVIDDKIVASQ